ncbi:MAG: sigma-70 family RNA polymerase sigma factor, partial [Steroidobacteraceae bacterium]
MTDSSADTRPNGSSPEALLARVAAGSREAFEALYRQTSGKLLGICLRVLAERAEAEEVLQEVFATVWRKAAQFDAGRASASVWLAMIARNRAIDRLRTRPARALMTPLDLAEEVEDPRDPPIEEVQAAADRERLEGCIRELEPRRRVL